jgi:hypothetical protein
MATRPRTYAGLYRAALNRTVGHVRRPPRLSTLARRAVKALTRSPR